MKFYTAVVKGDRFVVAQAAAFRGIPAAFMHEIKTTRETVIKVQPAFLDKLASWLAEAPEARVGGYPDGTLLIYSEHDQDDRPGGGSRERTVDSQEQQQQRVTRESLGHEPDEHEVDALMAEAAREKEAGDEDSE